MKTGQHEGKTVFRGGSSRAQERTPYARTATKPKLEEPITLLVGIAALLVPWRLGGVTASRELIELDALGVLKQVGGGRSTRYYVNLPGWVPAP